MVSYELHVNLNKCEGCNICDVACPVNAEFIKAGRKLTPHDAVLLVRNGRAVVYNQNKCTGCGVCIAACPQGAITISINAMPLH